MERKKEGILVEREGRSSCGEEGHKPRTAGAIPKKANKNLEQFFGWIGGEKGIKNQVLGEAV